MLLRKTTGCRKKGAKQGLPFFLCRSNSFNFSILNSFIFTLDSTTFSKGVRRGRIQLERYHLHVLKTLRETKNAIHYVLFNHQKHTGLKRAYITPYSSLGFVTDLK